MCVGFNLWKKCVNLLIFKVILILLRESCCYKMCEEYCILFGINFDNLGGYVIVNVFFVGVIRDNECEVLCY